MKKEKIQTGWLIIDKYEQRIYSFTFNRLRKGAIDRFMSVWDPKISWRSFRRVGYKCVKAQKTIKLL